jgi:hypothetical protein
MIMQKLTLFFSMVCMAFIFNACKSSDDTTVADPALAQQIVGTYNLTKITKSGMAVSGVTGSVTIKAVDNSTASLQIVLKLTTTSGSSNQDITNNYKISKSGTDYIVKDSAGATIGTVSGTKLTMSVYVISLSSSLGGNYDAEFTK